MGYTVFITAPTLATPGQTALADAGVQAIYLPSDGGAAEVEHILATEDVDAVISRTVELSALAIRSATRLKVISKHGVGVSNIAVDAATAANIPVHVTPGANAQSVAELTISLMLAAARRVPWMDAQLRAGYWNRAQDGIELHGRTLGLLGAGQVGQNVARIATSLGMRVLAYDPALGISAPSPEIEMVNSLNSLLESAKVLSLHVPLTEHTRNLIGSEQIARLPHDAIIVNTARGEVIDEHALVQSLAKSEIFAAGLDTTWNEPMRANDPLLTLPNVVLTPHVGGSTQSALDNMALAAARNVLDVLTGAEPASPAINASELNDTRRAQ